MDGSLMGIEGWLLIGAWIFALLVIVWLLVREPGRSRQDASLETLRSRLARGEISRDEFEQACRLLGL